MIKRQGFKKLLNMVKCQVLFFSQVPSSFDSFAGEIHAVRTKGCMYGVQYVCAVSVLGMLLG